MFNNLYELVWPTVKKKHDIVITVSVAESVSAGALSTALCAEAGASEYFKGSIVAYSILSKKDILNIDIAYAEKNNFANPFTTSEMARAAVRIFKSRIGMATTGYSLPLYRPENKELNECELNIKIPYAYICLYDSETKHEIVQRIEYTQYTDQEPRNKQRALFQAEIAMKGRNMYKDYIKTLLTGSVSKSVNKSISKRDDKESVSKEITNTKDNKKENVKELDEDDSILI